VLHKLKGEGGSRWGVGVGAEVDVAQGERDQGGGVACHQGEGCCFTTASGVHLTGRSTDSADAVHR
jgi:hypothetical protein